MGGLGRLAAWHVPGGPVGPPAWWATPSNKGGSGTEEEAQRPLAKERRLPRINYLQGSRVASFATSHGGPVCLISKGRVEQPPSLDKGAKHIEQPLQTQHISYIIHNIPSKRTAISVTISTKIKT